MPNFTKEFKVKVTTPDEYTTNYAVAYLTRMLEDSTKALAESSPKEFSPIDFEVIVDES